MAVLVSGAIAALRFRGLNVGALDCRRPCRPPRCLRRGVGHRARRGAAVMAGGSPTLTVVVPVFNQEREVAETLEAVDRAVARSPFSADAIVVDDGSTDGTACSRTRCRRLASGCRLEPGERGAPRCPARWARSGDRRLRPLHRQPRDARRRRTPLRLRGSHGRAAPLDLERARRDRDGGQPVRRLLGRGRPGRVRRLLLRPAHDLVRPGGVRRLPEGSRVLLRPARPARGGNRRSAKRLRRRAFRKRRHRDDQAAGGSRADEHLRPVSAAPISRDRVSSALPGTPSIAAPCFWTATVIAARSFFPVVAAFYPPPRSFWVLPRVEEAAVAAVLPVAAAAAGGAARSRSACGGQQKTRRHGAHSGRLRRRPRRRDVARTR